MFDDDSTGRNLNCYDPVFGARPLKRALQREVQNPLAVRILEGELSDGDTVVVDVKDGAIVFEAKR